jgi:hypothetical protein
MIRIIEAIDFFAIIDLCFKTQKYRRVRTCKIPHKIKDNFVCTKK